MNVNPFNETVKVYDFFRDVVISNQLGSTLLDVDYYHDLHNALVNIKDPFSLLEWYARHLDPSGQTEISIFFQDNADILNSTVLNYLVSLGYNGTSPSVTSTALALRYYALGNIPSSLGSMQKGQMFKYIPAPMSALEGYIADVSRNLDLYLYLTLILLNEDPTNEEAILLYEDLNNLNTLIQTFYLEENVSEFPMPKINPISTGYTNYSVRRTTGGVPILQSSFAPSVTNQQAGSIAPEINKRVRDEIEDLYDSEDSLTSQFKRFRV